VKGGFESEEKMETDEAFSILVVFPASSRRHVPKRVKHEGAGAWREVLRVWR
jgi:hypothetical protein